jgi:hypothetical protein
VRQRVAALNLLLDHSSKRTAAAVCANIILHAVSAAQPRC